MNFIIALLVLFGASKEPQIFYKDGKTLTTLKTIFIPSIRHESFKFFVESPYELRYASVDSTEIGMCLADQTTMKEMQLKGRWYKIDWETDLKTGSMKHTLFLNTRSGAIFKRSFIINVEGSKKIGKPSGEDR